MNTFSRIFVGALVLAFLFATVSFSFMRIAEEYGAGSGSGSTSASGIEAQMAFCEYPLGDPAVCDVVYEFIRLSPGSGEAVSATVQWEDVDFDGLNIPHDYMVSVYAAALDGVC